MKLLVGLGNPGQKYENTRHNIGFRFLDERASWNQLGNWKFESKYKAEIIKGNIGGEQILLCKPQTYMNLSGEAVAPLARFYQIPPENILVLHDEIDFVTGRIALKLGGSAAGHNGLKSIIEKLGTRDFWRLRIGVDRPAVSSQVSDWVLSSFKPEEKKLLADKQSEIFSFIDEFLE
ncbi:MAG: aminoacyl-tRNA hydrolase [candidate division SR1 bacterium]|nr:aminoacyl-tRNA hydrolase [candidate division SR1 bacterium]